MISPREVYLSDGNFCEENIGYKGFNEALCCKGFKFEIGKSYWSGAGTVRPEICSNQGFHFCKTLTEVFNYYPDGKTNRYCIILYGNSVSHGSDKSCATHIRILRELSREEIENIKKEEKLKKFHKSIHLQKIKEFLTDYPMAHLAGSLSLFLHGCKLKRLEEGQVSDVDVVLPYFVEIPSTYENGERCNEDEKDYRSGSDFDFCTMYNGLKVDVVINNKERYETIEYDGFKFKVNKLEDVLASKLKYAQQGNKKHRDDIYELLGKNK